MSALIRRHPVLSYYVMVFAISWGGMLIVVSRIGFPNSGEEVARAMPLVLVPLFAGPSISGLVMTAVMGGRAGLRELGARLLRWRVGARWYAVALLTGPVLVAAVLLGLSIVSPAYLPGIVTAENRLALLLFGIAWGLVGGGFLEELGWTGFAVPTLRLARGPVATGLIVGLLWGAWHLLVAFWGSRGMARGGSLALFVVGFVAFYLAALPAYRVLMVWIYDRTQSLLVAMLMHAVLSASTLILQPQATGAVVAIWNLVLAAALWVIVGAAANRAAPSEAPDIPSRR